MKRWITTGLTLLLTAVILVAGFFSMDIIKALFPSDLNTIVAVDAAEKAMLLYVDTEEDLVFYPWTTYRRENTISILDWVKQQNFSEGDIEAQWDIVHYRIQHACEALDSQYAPQNTSAFHNSLRYQPSNDKMYLPSCAYSAVNGQTYLLDMVLADWDMIEAIHITPQQPLPELSNDERVQCTERLEKEILNNRSYRGEMPIETDGMTAEPFSHPSVQPSSMAGSRRSVYMPSPSMPPSNMLINIFLLDSFSKLYYSLSDGNGLVSNETLSYLLFTGVYQMVYYENEILLFFLPNEKASVIPDIDADKGLLLYINPSDLHINGFHLLDLNA